MDNNGVQQLFFQHIKNSLPPHLSLVESIADVLNISNDSAYRRIRGEKQITFEEIQKLSAHFKISLDQFLHLKSDSFLFSGALPDNTEDYFGIWLDDVLQKLTYIKGFDEKCFYFNTKDLPIFGFFQIPELANFKFFLWMRTFLRYENLKSRKFSLKRPFEEFVEKGKKIIRAYNQIPTVEIWSLDCLNATIRQIEFYKESNVFESDEDVVIIYDKLEELINHYEQQAEVGKKFTIGEPANSSVVDYSIFLNELSIGDNTVIAELNKTKVSFINHSVISIISTRDERFCNKVYDSMRNLINKSTQISTIGEKTRSHFFMKLRDRINQRKKAITK
jgi:hypothetical protein